MNKTKKNNKLIKYRKRKVRKIKSRKMKSKKMKSKKMKSRKFKSRKSRTKHMLKDNFKIGGVSNIPINIISFNLEELCHYKVGTTYDPLTSDAFKQLIFDKNPSFVCLQELSSKSKNDINKNIDIILQNVNDKYKPITDNFTNAIIYDEDQWDNIYTLLVNRKIDDKPDSDQLSSDNTRVKKTMCVLYQYKRFKDYKLWVVNIHLKAGANRAKHVFELKNIFDKINIYNRENKYQDIDILLAGDFNDISSKYQLIQDAGSETLNNKSIYEICCNNTPTHDAKYMHCETIKHKVAAAAAKMVSIKHSYDSIIFITLKSNIRINSISINNTELSDHFIIQANMNIIK